MAGVKKLLCSDKGARVSRTWVANVWWAITDHGNWYVSNGYVLRYLRICCSRDPARTTIGLSFPPQKRAPLRNALEGITVSWCVQLIQ
jgi:hypothetical protein